LPFRDVSEKANPWIQRILVELIWVVEPRYLLMQ